jgi:deoxyribodipyrimidine photo-lyase
VQLSTAVVWFRRDLRLADNPALITAIARHDQVIPLFVHCREEQGTWPDGGALRWWLHHSLRSLSSDLNDLGVRLMVREAPTDEVLADIIEATGARAVYWNRLYEPALVERDREIKRWLREERGVAAESFNASLLYEPWQVETGQGDPYKVFTPFWRRLQGHGLPDHVEPAPEHIPGPAEPPASESIELLGLKPAIPWDEGLEVMWTPGEAGAHARLQQFCDDIVGQYAMARERPAHDGTSMLSPYLHFGEIGPRQIVRALRDRGLDTKDSAATFLSELGWREFAHHLLFHFPETPERPLNRRFEEFPWRDPEGEAADDLAAWEAGRTGVPLVDAGMRQLWHTGWMHNRLRMVVASFLTKNLRINWLVGARWFWDTLVDADLANNTLGWQWAGGCGADAAPYFRIFNPVRQGERFDPQGEFVREWVPEIAALPDKHIHAPWQAPAGVLCEAGIELGRDYPEPIVDLKASRQAALGAFEQIRSHRS